MHPIVCLLALINLTVPFTKHDKHSVKYLYSSLHLHHTCNEGCHHIRQTYIYTSGLRTQTDNPHYNQLL